MIQTLFDSGLLKNNFSNPNIVGIFGFSERKLSAVDFVPCQ
jgi:hypothetical protein